ncbi:MAG: DUF116 domain-containing protein, partial [bacterium]
MTQKYPTYHFGKDFREKLDSFVNQFIKNGFEEFSDEFTDIDEFVSRALTDDSNRNDKKLRSTPKEKYLLEVVAFKIYDELNRKAFNKTDRTLIVLPDCLSLHNPDCEKKETSYGDICMSCTNSCRAFSVMELAKKYNAEVTFSKRKLEQQLGHYKKELGDVGVIGIACIMMLANGMRKAIDEGVPTRGVFLSFTGCEHWNDEPFASGFQLSWL